jgi:hypothetical protein
MKKPKLLLFILSLFIMGMANAPKDTEIQRIDLLLNSWHKAAAVADEKTYFDSMAPGAIFLGTDATERWTKEEFEKWALPYFQRESAWIFEPFGRHVYLSNDGNTAWFEESLNSKSYWISRGSGVLEKIKGEWRIRQYNLALTVPNESIKAIKPIIEKALKESMSGQK